MKRAGLSEKELMKRILIYRRNGAGTMWLCADGNLSSNRDEAQEHWESQFIAAVSPFWLHCTGGILSYEVVQ